MSSAAGPGAGWRWVADRDPGDGSFDQAFPSQGEAESWLGEVYPDLVAREWERSACTKPTGSSTGR